VYLGMEILRYSRYIITRDLLAAETLPSQQLFKHGVFWENYEMIFQHYARAVLTYSGKQVLHNELAK